MNYYIGDPHFGHENIMRHSKRPFSSIEAMNQAIINDWNSTVTDKDDVYILGDFSFKGDDPVTYIKQLKGKKYLIKGNHDKITPEFKSHLEWVKDYFEVIDNGQRIVLFHYPIVEWNGYYRDTIHFYAHTHNNVDNLAYKLMLQVPNAYNTGVDVIGFGPRTMAQVIERNKEFDKNH